MAKKAKTTRAGKLARPSVVGYNERELISLLSGGRQLIQDNLSVIERRLGSQTFAHKHPVYERKREQLQQLLEIEISGTTAAILKGILRPEQPIDHKEMQSTLKKLEIKLPVTEGEMYNGQAQAELVERLGLPQPATQENANGARDENRE